MNRYLKYGLGLSLFILIAYNSVYFVNLEAFRGAEETVVDFELKARELYNDILVDKDIVGIADLKNKVQTNVDATFLEFGNRLGIGNSAFFRVSINGEVTNLPEGGIEVRTEKGETYFVNSKFIFGNSIRDASGLVTLTDYKTNAEFNKLSEALNTLIRETVIPQAIEKLSIGDAVLVEAALKLTKGQSLNAELNLLPISIHIIEK